MRKRYGGLVVPECDLQLAGCYEFGHDSKLPSYARLGFLVEMKVNGCRSHVLIFWFGVVFVSLIFGLSYGFNYGVSNNNTYLVHALVKHVPEILKNDWFVSQTESYHPIFSYLAFLMYGIDDSGWIFGIFCVVFTAAVGVSIGLLVRTVSTSSLEAAFVFSFVIAVNLITRTTSVSQSYIAEGTFQASLIAALGYILSFCAYILGRYLASGFILAVFTVFHANYLVLCFPLFALAHILESSPGLMKRVFRQYVMLTISIVVSFPMIFETAVDPQGEEGKYIFQHIVAPIHYVPLTYLKEFVPFISWQLLGLLLGWSLARSDGPLKKLYYLLISASILIWIATFLTTAVFIPTVSQAYFWRLAPFSDLMCQIVVGLAVYKYLFNTASIRERLDWATRIRLLVLFFGVLALCWYYLWKTKFSIVIAVVIIGALAVVKEYRCSQRQRLVLIIVSAAVVLVTGMVVPLRDVVARSSLLSGFPTAEDELYQWVKFNTDRNSVFLTSPKLYNFRLHAERAIIVDEKSTPILGKGLAEWYRRMEMVSGVVGFKDIDTAALGYELIDSARLQSIQAIYPFDYVVVGVNSPLMLEELVFVNRQFRVYSYSVE